MASELAQDREQAVFDDDYLDTDSRVLRLGTSQQLDENWRLEAELGFSYRPDPAWRLFLRADQGYRFAKVDEHSNVVFGQPVGLDTQRGTSTNSIWALTTTTHRSRWTTIRWPIC